MAYAVLKLLYFVFFAGKGVLEPYLPVFYEILSMSKWQVGVLGMIGNINAFVFAPLFGGISDIYSIHCEVMVIATVASLVCTLLMLLAQSFETMLVIVFFATAFRAPTTPQIDALVINSLDDRTRYGEMRLWGAISFGIFSFLGGALTQDHSIGAFKSIFFAHAAFFLCTCFVVLCSYYKSAGKSVAGAHSPTAKSLPMHAALRHVLREHPSVLLFSVIVLLSGIGTGVIDSFLFLRLKQLGGSGFVMGISRFITCAAEVPMFRMAGYLQKRFGTYRVLVVTQLAYVLRFVYYANLTDPWAVLPCEVLHGLTYATTWSVACTYANLISPPECHSTMQALLEGLHWGFGSGIGALLGGFVYDRLGAVWLFELSAVLSLLSMVLAILGVGCVESDADAAESGYDAVESQDADQVMVKEVLNAMIDDEDVWSATESAAESKQVELRRL